MDFGKVRIPDSRPTDLFAVGRQGGLMWKSPLTSDLGMAVVQAAFIRMRRKFEFVLRVEKELTLAFCRQKIKKYQLRERNGLDSSGVFREFTEAYAIGA